MPCKILTIGSSFQEGDGQINAVGKRLAWGEARRLAARRYAMFMTMPASFGKLVASDATGALTAVERSGASSHILQPLCQRGFGWNVFANSATALFQKPPQGLPRFHLQFEHAKVAPIEGQSLLDDLFRRAGHHQYLTIRIEQHRLNSVCQTGMRYRARFSAERARYTLHKAH